VAGQDVCASLPKANAEFVWKRRTSQVYKVRTIRFDRRLMDETSKQLSERHRRPVDAAPGRLAGGLRVRAQRVADLFMFFEPLACGVWITPQRREGRMGVCVKQLLDEHYPQRSVCFWSGQPEYHTVGHCTRVSRAEARRVVERLEVHTPPSTGSWLNMRRRELSVLSGNASTGY